MPLSMAHAGEKVMVFKTGGNDSIRQHLADMGFVPGTSLNVISQHSGDVIVNLKESHLAITKQLAQKIMITQVC
jgi:ferrous iron transport protein A